MASLSEGKATKLPGVTEIALDHVFKSVFRFWVVVLFQGRIVTSINIYKHLG